jgi:cytochrome c peroxidase
MKKLIFILLLLAQATGYTLISCKQNSQAPEKQIEKTVLEKIDSFTTVCTKLQSSAESGSFSPDSLQKLFLQARLAYKKFEWAAEYFVPATTRFVNGPPVQEIEMPELRVTEPAGLQVIEGFLFPRYDTSRKKEFLRQLNLLQLNCDQYKIWFSKNDIFDFQVFDAAKLEVFRIMTLGITGFDNPLTLKSSQESAASLESLQILLDNYKNKEDIQNISGKFDAAITYLRVNPDFNSFNRMEFITVFCNPVTAGIISLREKLKIHFYKYNRLLNQDAKTLFDTNAFNVNAYAPDHSSFISNEKIALGKKLFADPVLSGRSIRSCRSCHQPEKAFTDGLAKNSVIGRDELLERNTPTLINAALQPSLFYDLRVSSLEDQSHSVVQSRNEMRGSMTRVVKKLWQDKKYREMFLTAYPNEDQNGIDTFEVMNAIGSYIRSLTLLNSRFDEYMRGDHKAMHGDEINGFNLFMGKAKCATCHYMPLFNGTLPPGFVNMETEVIAVPQAPGIDKIDPDMGRYNIVKVESLRHAFKTSTVRNAARTAPYMHNGVFSSLEQVVDFYNRGGGVGLGIKIENQTLPSDSLNLTRKEQDDIIAFIRSLDSKMPGE